MKPNNIYNTPIDDQIKNAIFQQIAEESHNVNIAISQIKSNIRLICNSGLSKEMKRKKINEIVCYIKNNSNPWIDNSKEINTGILK
jgi:uncharacterized protein YdcH (DUF465 family)